jgi:hypothetical protein
MHRSMRRAYGYSKQISYGEGADHCSHLVLFPQFIGLFDSIWRATSRVKAWQFIKCVLRVMGRLHQVKGHVFLLTNFFSTNLWGIL